MTVRPRLSTTIAFLLVSIGRQTTTVHAAPAPTCQSFGKDWYFPNACVSDCANLSSDSTMDIDRSRNVGGNLKCYCTGREQPLCTDEPTCSDKEVSPGSALADCRAVCESDDVSVTDDIEFAGDDSAANKNQTHFRVSCSCNTADEGLVCGTDYILFSDLTYLPSCTGRGENSLQIKSVEACNAHCTASNALFVSGSWNGDDTSCSCLDAESKLAIACDNSRSNFNDGSGLGNPCYETVGVTTVECSAAVPKTTTTTMLVSTTVLMGIWLLPW